MYAVIDTETTGLNLSDDRVIELAVIGLDAIGEIEWEWCSLINPERNTGHGLAVRAHQIYPRDVAEAPTFREMAGYIAELLHGRVLIAHNARFDIGMLGAEYGRIGVSMPEVVQICTADLARDCGFRPWTLEACCVALEIELDGMHHALADARAACRLAHKIFDFTHEGLRAEVVERLRKGQSWPDMTIERHPAVTRPILPCRKKYKRDVDVGSEGAKQHGVFTAGKSIPVLLSHTFELDTPELKYLAAVERVLEDREISDEERGILAGLVLELDLTEKQAHEVHMNFIRGLAGSMWDDGEISAHEKYDLDVVGKLLGLSDEDISFATQNPIGLSLINDEYKLRSGQKVVFTGEMSISRSEWTERAKAAELRVTGSVSGKTDYLVVPYGETGSSKSRKARELGVKVVSEQRFLRMFKQFVAG